LSRNTCFAGLALFAALAAAGCGIDLTNGGLACSSDGKCPPGYHCAVDNSCWKNGSDPSGGNGDGGDDLGDDMGVPDDLAGGGSPDLAPPPDLTPTLTNGQLCAKGGDCISGFCADGVCCNAQCNDNCKSCNQPTALGMCSPIAAGGNPAHGTCGPDSASSCGKDGVCDGSGNCRLYGNTTVCLAGSCNSTTNKVTADSKCDGAGHCVTPTAIACDPYVCNGNVCFASCSSPAQCKGAMPCNSNQCGPKINGSPCATATECGSGNCVDGVCCDTPQAMCTGCKQCNLASSLGTCANVPPGQDPHSTCGTNNATCTAGGCNGSNTCTPSTNTIVCKTTCGSTNQLSTTLCNGVSTGCTNTPSTAPCSGNLVCKDMTSCQPNCNADGDNDCVSTAYCSAGNCTPKQADGAPCSANDQCTSNVCTGFHRDADGDGQGVLATTMFCGTSPPSGYVTNAMDCCDADANVKVGQTGWFISGSANCGNTFDYDCSGTAEHEFTGTGGGCMTAGTCNLTTGLSCNTNVGWVGATEPGCPGSGTWVSGCNHAAPCTPCSDPGSCGAGCAAAQQGARTQACH
jgi:hypothetical protein